MNEETPRKVLIITSDLENNTYERTERYETPEEVTKRIAQEKEDTKQEEYNQSHTEPIKCDSCRKYICEAYACDLNGSRFYHQECITT